MKLNMGVLDRIIRIVIAAIVAALYFLKQISGTAAIILGVIAVIFVITGFVGWCPIYAALGLSTKEKPKEGTKQDTK